MRVAKYPLAPLPNKANPIPQPKQSRVSFSVFRFCRLLVVRRLCKHSAFYRKGDLKIPRGRGITTTQQLFVVSVYVCNCVTKAK
jgi:hypothetical protein